MCHVVRCQSMTYLEKDLDTLQWCNHCFRKASCNTARQKLLQMKFRLEYRPILKLPEIDAGICPPTQS